MNRDAFSQCHPLVNFVFFLGAIGFGVVIQHPAYIAAGCLGGASYYLLLNPRMGWKTILGMIPVFFLLAAANPLFNVYGRIVLFQYFGRPYTLEALLYGMAIGGIFLVMMLWFFCCSTVLTSDKFICLFGSLIPALSLLLTMVLRLVPNLARKAQQILGSRKSIGKGAQDSSTNKEKMLDAVTVLSALTDWALEGSVVTADSMRSRGYGTAKRSSFQIYRLTKQDAVLLVLMLILAAATLFPGGFEATYTPELYIPAPSFGLAAYCIYLLIPIFLHIKEAIAWHISISRI